MPKAKYPSDEAYRFLLRMPRELREKLEAASQESGRSMNAEALARLTSSFDPQRPVLTDVQESVIREVTEKVTRQILDIALKDVGLSSPVDKDPKAG